MAENRFEQIQTGAIIGVFVLAIVGIALAVGFSREENAASTDDTITVQGEAFLETAPDQAEVYLRLQTKGLSVADVQSVNRQTMNHVYAQLEAFGIKEKNIETTSYNLYPLREWEKERMVDKGYQLDHVIKVTLTDLDQVGKVVDEGVQAGMNGVDNILFSLTRKKQQEIRSEVLAMAAEQAKAKAKGIADGLGVKLGEVEYVSESSANYPVPMMYAKERMYTADAAMAPEPTPITPGDVTVSAAITVAYEIE
ncbi:SIMPL domain-containing protein [Candidatus Woesearchaeota archaeon]|nr:SIMPL domain-containing protein [Candidatus Woesearchaeota archaeon]